jgi:hypothetical protein
LGISRNDITRIVVRDAGLTTLSDREKVEDRLADGFVLGCTIDSGHGNPFHRVPQVNLGNGVEESLVRSR